MKHVKSITIGCENCELFEIDSKSIGICEIDNIVKKVRRLAINAIEEYNKSDRVIIEIFGGFDNSKDIIERLAKYNDIASIDLNLEDGTTESIYVEYEPKNDNIGAPNLLQHSIISELGNLYITIGHGICLNEYVKNINDEEEINSYRRMIQ